MPSDINPRSALLRRATRIVNDDRNKSYGDPSENLATIADMWNTMFGGESTAHDVALAMIAVKLSRLVTTPNHEDSWTDIAGYAAIGWECVVDEETDEDPPGEEVDEGVIKIAVDG